MKIEQLTKINIIIHIFTKLSKQLIDGRCAYEKYWMLDGERKSLAYLSFVAKIIKRMLLEFIVSIYLMCVKSKLLDTKTVVTAI